MVLSRFFRVGESGRKLCRGMRRGGKSNRGCLVKNKYFICNECMLRGSRVRGQNDSNADVDLLVVSKDFKDMIISKRKELVIKAMQNTCLNVEVDVICLRYIFFFVLVLRWWNYFRFVY